MVKNLPADAADLREERRVQSLGQEDPLEKSMAVHSSVLAWRIPWIEGPGGLQSMGSQRDATEVTELTVIKLYTTLCNPMGCSAPGSSALHDLLEFTQIPVYSG